MRRELTGGLPSSVTLTGAQSWVKVTRQMLAGEQERGRSDRQPHSSSWWWRELQCSVTLQCPQQLFFIRFYALALWPVPVQVYFWNCESVQAFSRTHWRSDHPVARPLLTQDGTTWTHPWLKSDSNPWSHCSSSQGTRIGPRVGCWRLILFFLTQIWRQRRSGVPSSIQIGARPENFPNHGRTVHYGTKPQAIVTQRVNVATRANLGSSGKHATTRAPRVTILFLLILILFLLLFLLLIFP
jgi:hypothetical protein